MGLKEQLAAARKDASEFIAKLKADGHEVTDDELAEARTKSDLVTNLVAKVERQDALKGFSTVTAVDEDPQEKAPARTLGEHFAKAVGDTLRVARGQKGFSVSAPEFKAATDAQSIPTVVAPALTTIDTNIVTGVRRRLTVADLLGSETISGNALTYFVEGALIEGGFANVAELGKKPQLHFGDPTPVTEALAKIAGFLKESDEILEDVPWLVSAINNRLLYELGLNEENQLLSGTGTGGNIRGLLNRSGVQVVASANRTDNADAVFRAITAVSLNGGIEADGLVINPADYQTLRLSKDGNGQYFGGGFFAGEYGQGGIVQQPPVWGLRTVVTPAIAAGTALVGAYGQAASVIRKGGVRVETTNSDVDDFEYNRVTIRAEERLALAVRRPAGFAKVTFSSVAPA
ncbi:HK97 family phage major capsid protein [Frigoribacterium sp. PvP120]|uniref:phage major capsid protein n=1 Tax=unclassified Frigoribacterium TaxID=2627005 RepID=UPI001AE3B774|nr:phage major capsid protein [Frigoribacterium sp. PvP121]MBP1241738.1 HK97 family phage major capsid protein [Frigoribacterium sp. PvP121]